VSVGWLQADKTSAPLNPTRPKTKRLEIGLRIINTSSSVTAVLMTFTELKVYFQQMPSVSR
jgi:hypothetical protein